MRILLWCGVTLVLLATFANLPAGDGAGASGEEVDEARIVSPLSPKEAERLRARWRSFALRGTRYLRGL